MNYVTWMYTVKKFKRCMRLGNLSWPVSMQELLLPLFPPNVLVMLEMTAEVQGSALVCKLWLWRKRKPVDAEVFAVK